MKRLFLAGMGLCGAMTLGATVTLPKFFTDNMLVQRDATLKIPGKAAPGAKVTFRTDWAEKPFTTKADKEGNFKFEVPTPAAGGPYTMIFSDGMGDDLVLSNVLSGELWLCSGQSNMEYPVKGWTEIYNGDEVVATSQHPDIRLLQVRKNTSLTPLDDAEVNMGGWVESSPATMDFSAIAYLFALRLHDELGVPVGVIDSSWGGTYAESWTGFDYLGGVPGFEDDLASMKKAGFSEEGFRADYSRRLEDWNRRVEGLDITFDRGKLQTGDEWKTMPLPGVWEQSVLPDFDGMVWLQRTLTLPAEAAGKPMELHVGAVDDNDLTLVNGTVVGSTEGWNLPRVYQVPGNLVKAGENVISVRVLDYIGSGGVHGRPEDLCAIIDGVTYPLAGDWNYRIAGDITSLPRRPEMVDSPHLPTTLYNAMIHPLQVMPVKGVLWYQGCSNVGRDKQYEVLFQSLIKDWRHLWREDMPFYFVQLTGFQTPKNVQPESTWALLRNSQAKALSLPNTGMAVTLDLGHPTDIHPADKQEIARRLSLIALARDYGKDCVYSAPECVSATAHGNKMVLKFNGPVKPTSTAVTGFIIGDKNGKFAYANARLEGDDTVVLSSPLIESPTVARYNWADYPGGNLYGPANLPVAPFATDK